MTIEPAPRAAQSLPLFHFGKGRSPLVIVAGGLIYDTGEAERTFLYRCQDRFLAYTSLFGWQSIFFALNETHVTTYRRLIDRLSERFCVTVQAIGNLQKIGIVEPVFVLMDVDTLALRPSARLIERLNEPALRAAISDGIAMNQISPTYANLAERLARLFRDLGCQADWPLDACRAAAARAMRLQDKALYTRLVVERQLLPERHLPTAIFSEAELAGVTDWTGLAGEFGRRTGAEPPIAMFVKTARNTSGNIAGRFDAASFLDERERLFQVLAQERSEDPGDLQEMARGLGAEIADNPALRTVPFTEAALREMKREQAGRRHDLEILLQGELSPRAVNAETPAGIGVSYRIDSVNACELIALNAQLYRDPRRRHFLGGYLGPELVASVRQAVLQDCEKLCRSLAADGYRGPVNFDLFQDARGAYRFVHDCNPRLTGIFPSLAVRAGIAGGHVSMPVLSTGYRGECRLPHLDVALGRLVAPRLLYRSDNAAGLVILPNLAADDGYDMHVVGMPMRQAIALFAADGPLARALQGDLMPTAPYL